MWFDKVIWKDKKGRLFGKYYNSKSLIWKDKKGKIWFFVILGIFL